MPASSSSGSEEKRPPNIDSAAGASDEPLPLTPSPGPDRRCSALGRMLGRRSSSEQSSENGSERTPTPGNRRMSGGRRNSGSGASGTSPQGGTPSSSVGGSVPRIRRSSNPENQRPGSAGSSAGTSRGSRNSPDISSRLIRRASEVGDSVKSFRDVGLSKSQTLTKAPTVNLIQDVAAKATFVIDPDSKAVKYFYLFLLMALLYNAWMIPFRIAFLQVSARPPPPPPPLPAAAAAAVAPPARRTTTSSASTSTTSTAAAARRPPAAARARAPCPPPSSTSPPPPPSCSPGDDHHVDHAVDYVCDAIFVRRARPNPTIAPHRRSRV